ncbi:hypothetical protein [Streptomyces sp. 8L]|uniref:hypothetical protein n=1 Tax=Streptomyces sp. 8L TaxID=2877242 RepID=UPI001CD6B643|nr:hypothetical protein [Streptomyces sp. 8L]MCA1218859.1 hypothetical protein [Streptomyces sp. 8L]
MSPTPKQARTHRRKANSADHTKNVNSYRVEASWNDRPSRPAVFRSPDRKKARRVARQWADDGAYVIVQEHTGWDTWRTLDEIDGPALLAEARRAAAEARHGAEEQQRASAEAARAQVAAAEQSERDRATLARMMVRPPVARDQCGRREARHITGAQR